MRELKFRAWDKVAGKYLYPYPDGFSILGETTCFDLIGQQLHEREPKDKTTLEKLNDVEIEQFTGLLDKNGKEIYEGDIVRVTPDYDGKYLCIGQYEIDVIGFNNGKFYVKGLASEFELINLSIKIIGNIHENPELLEEK